MRLFGSVGLIAVSVCRVFGFDTWLKPCSMHNASGGSAASGQLKSCREDMFKFTNPKKQFDVEWIEKKLASIASNEKTVSTEEGDLFSFTPYSKGCRCQAAKRFGIADCGGAYAVDWFKFGGDEFGVCKGCQYAMLAEEEEKKKMKDQETAKVTGYVVPGSGGEIISIPLKYLNGKPVYESDGTTPKFIQVRVVGGISNVLMEGLISGELSITYWDEKLGDPAKISKFMKKVSETRKYWNSDAGGDGTGRGSAYLSTSLPNNAEGGGAPGTSGRYDTWGPTRIALEEYPPFKEFFEVVERDHECTIYDGHMTYTKPENKGYVTMKEHGDKKYPWKPWKRGILTLGSNCHGDTKVMRFTDMEHGRWVDIEIPHGTFIELGPTFSGTESPRYIHGIRNAQGTYSLVIDYGKEKRN